MNVGNTAPFLPPLVRLEDFGGDEERWIEEVYAWFRREILESPPLFQGRPCSVRRRLLAGREETFWHLVTVGSGGPNQAWDPGRGERIRWIRVLIEAADGAVRVWRQTRSGEQRYCIALPDFSYLVVLAEAGASLALVTAYPVRQPHTRRRLEREWAARI